ncbi:hypothetical protein K7402_05065 [Pseudomonas fluorescens group sp.]|uniref:Uncharacterized protein n=2 Tax=Pseudomonas fluorescens TaxID=294 RepID=C3KA48_PSEFS|nr:MULTISPECIES: hypothetical protein [Pseudomonas fluorescens group]MBZ6453912.1 hypothetical protein [Pseudomonas fluorescens group sp.]MBZ6459898.1 hypothetical protein [Pseudomonas fluorescens group sp.]MBZ6466789.1 hypothetical protein [Pseudomonas fluorescens group sp.]WQD75072.1 hypothetical protein U0037_14355 [Pseudomonas marginalis]CAI2797094.1 Uncharacterized protein PFLU_2871 [Pseudomonas fluorescens SBW25]
MTDREDVARAIKALSPKSEIMEFDFTPHAPKILRELADEIEKGTKNLKSAAWHCSKSTPHIQQMVVTIERDS